MRREFPSGACACLLLCGLACTGPTQQGPTDPLEAILAASDHHLEQHPDKNCRVDWRPDALAVADVGERPQAAALVQTARSYTGTPYDYGGVDQGGLDCSGFVNRVFAAHGYDLPRTSRAQYRVGVQISREDVAPGDLVFFTKRAGGKRINHVGLYVGEGSFVHASSGRREVVVDPLDLRYYAQRWAGARRITTLPPGRYSAADGGAREHMLFSTLDAARTHFAGREPPCRETEYRPLTATVP